MTVTSVAISFTGGKDCCLALHKAVDQGYRATVLVVFAPENQRFRAHPLAIIKRQSEALGIPYTICTIKGPHYLASYRENLATLKEDYHIQGLVTGDIIQVCSDFMERACENILALIRPLWQLPRQELLNDILPFNVTVTCINRRRLPSSDDLERGKSGVGDDLSWEWIKQHVEIDNADLAGEYGEYHTMVTYSPLFKHGRIKISGFQEEEGDYIFYNVTSAELIPV